MKVRGVFVAFGLAASVTAFASGFSDVYVFGDSLSDVGNVYAATGGLEPGAPYYDGRYSNGPLWCETLASHFGVTLTPSYTGGNDFAWGGAETGTGTSAAGTPNVGTQIQLFASSVGSFSSTDLVTLWAGGNDFIDGQTNPAAPVANIKTELNAMYALGARNVLVPNLPDLGEFPGTINTPLEGLANLVTEEYDSDLQTMLNGLGSSDPGLKIYQLNTETIFAAIQADPGKYGITNTTQAYIGSGSTANPNTYLFFDSVHPTANVHNIIGEAAIATVPEPSVFVGLGLGLLALLRKRRS